MQSMNSLNDLVSRNWQTVVGEVAEAALRYGRTPAEVLIVGVTKYVDFATTRALVRAGCSNLGESRPQSLWEKGAAFQAEAVSPGSLSGADASEELHWHLIGHLQRNKVRRTIPWVSLLHSLDSLRLAEAISEEAVSKGFCIRCLLEVNISGEAAKGGFVPEETLSVVDAVANLPGIEVCGLMGMAAMQSDTGSESSEVRKQFASLRTLRDTLVARGLPERVTLNELSMGMSGDFVEAIAEGSTMVRIGSRLFDGT